MSPRGHASGEFASAAARKLQATRRWRSPMTKTLIASLVLAAAGAVVAQTKSLDGGLGQSGIAAALRPLRLPPEVRRLADIAYGAEARQRFDAYLPARPRGAPIIVMVHGGAWRVGNKALPQVVENKVAHWVGQGAILVSVNYRLAPQVTPVEQADDVARAVAKVQALAASWGGDPERVVLMGHSAGAHLVALVGAAPGFALRAGARPWLGTIALDSAALNLVALMRAPHARFYDPVFGSDPAAWQAASPADRLTAGAPPFLLLCSTRRADGSCEQSATFAMRAQALGVRAVVSAQGLSHGEINAQLGLPGSATDAVDAFLASIGFGAR